MRTVPWRAGMARWMSVFFSLAFLTAPAAASVIYLTDGGNRIAQFDVDTGAFTIKAAPNTALSIAGGQTADTPYIMDGVGNLYVYTFSTNTTALIAPTGMFPTAMGEGGDGFLYSTGHNNGETYRITPASGTAAFVGNNPLDYNGDLASTGGVTYAMAGSHFVILDRGTAGMTPLYPLLSLGLASTLDGRLFVANGGFIQQIDPGTGALTPLWPVPPLGFLADMGSEVLVPEPASLLLLLGCAGALARRR